MPTDCATRLTLVKEKRISKARIKGTKTVGKGVDFSRDMLIFQEGSSLVSSERSATACGTEKRLLPLFAVRFVTNRKTRLSNCWRDRGESTFATPAWSAVSRSCKKSGRNNQVLLPPNCCAIVHLLTPQPNPTRWQRRRESQTGEAPPKAPESRKHCGPDALSTRAANALVAVG